MITFNRCAKLAAIATEKHKRNLKKQYTLTTWNILKHITSKNRWEIKCVILKLIKEKKIKDEEKKLKQTNKQKRWYEEVKKIGAVVFF